MEEFHIEEAHRELVSTFRFTTYYEPLKRWPFTADDGLRKRTKTHGDFPRLLLEQSATKGISRHKKVRYSTIFKKLSIGIVYRNIGHVLDFSVLNFLEY